MQWNAECRKVSSGTMCPSYQVTHDERHTTRARAQSLSALVNGEVSLSEMQGNTLHDVLDLCIQCKGCKSECPSQIDIAKIKSEVLYQHHQKYPRLMRDHIFGNLDNINKLFSPITFISNRLMQSRINKKFMSMLNIAPEREFPLLAPERFSKWFYKRHSKSAINKHKVLLLVDTFTEYNFPEIGKDAVKVLEKLGCYVTINEYSCCGRPMLSKGLLLQARQRAQRLMFNLFPYVENGYSIVGIEPSCILTIKDEYPSLINDASATKIAKACTTIDNFLHTKFQKELKSLPFISDGMKKVCFHGHCHQKSIEGTKASIQVLETLPGIEVEEVNSGCCGMAGSFGYEKEHYDFSLQIAETRLFPFLRKQNSDSLIVANGISCRQQIGHGLQRNANHLIQVLADHL